MVLIHGHTLKLGYLSREDTVNLKDVSYDLTYFDENPERSVEGTYRLEAEDGTIVSGRLEPISGVEIDLSHSLPTQPHIYRRTLVRLHPDDGGPPFVGWMEINRMLA